MEEQGKVIRAILNGELLSSFWPLPSAYCRLPLKSRRSGERDLRYPCLLPTAYCPLPTSFEGSSSWRASWPVPQFTTNCHRRQEEKRL
jgi:hypothetical protein